MSVNKTLKGRVINKHKTEAEWYLDVYTTAGGTTKRTEPFVPYDGELIIYDPDSIYNHRRFKIGDGTKDVVALPFWQGNPTELSTTNKTIVLAINELKGRIDALPTKDTDTKNTTGTTNTGSKIFLVGATAQGTATDPQAVTYTHDTAYVGTDGCLYSNSKKTLTVAGGELSDNATLKFSMYGNRFLTISGNSILADMSQCTGGWAGAFASVKHNTVDGEGNKTTATTTMLGWYGGANNLTHIFMGGTYSNPAMKMTPDGTFTFSKTINGTITNATNATNATTATKLGNTNVGSTKQPIYLSKGQPTVISYTIEKSVPSDAKFTDTTYDVFVKSGSSAKSGLVPAPSTTAGTTKYLREDGTWQVPAYIADTHYTTGLYVGATNTKANAATTNGGTYLKLYDDNTRRAEFKITGSGATTVTSDANGNITITSANNNTAHSHTQGGGLVITGTGGISGSVDYKLASPSTTYGTDAMYITAMTAAGSTQYRHSNVTLSTAGDIGAVTYKINSKATIKYDSTNECVRITF